MAADIDCDILIIGSGPSGAHAAQRALESGAKVGLLDIGFTDDAAEQRIPEMPFWEIRAQLADQSKIFIGESVSEAFEFQNKAGAHLTPARRHMIRDMERIFPLHSNAFYPLQSTSLGGLGVSWGANCYGLDETELHAVGLAPGEMEEFYRETVEEVGVSADLGDPCTRKSLGTANRQGRFQPPLELDQNAKTVLEKHRRRIRRRPDDEFMLGPIALASLTRPLDGRLSNRLWDMDFWSNHGKSVYRPRYTFEKIRQCPNFTYFPGRVAESFEEHGDGTITLRFRKIAASGGGELRARTLILAAGAINSARIALRSLPNRDSWVPILCNPNHWIATINWALLGKDAPDRRQSLAQLTALMEFEEGERIVAQFYSYRSLLIYRLLPDLPLPPRLGVLFMRLILNSLTIVNLHFPDRPSDRRRMRLSPSGDSDPLQVEFSYSADELRFQKRAGRRFLRRLLGLGCIPISVSKPAPGASVHYAGTLPFSDKPLPYHCSGNGILHGTRRVFVADASTWRRLPAKGLTLTLMAHARRIGKLAAEMTKESSRRFA